MVNNSISILSVQTGKVKPFGTGKHTSAINKVRTAKPVLLTQLGLEGDEQAEKQHHGGKEMALLHYPFEHYATWRSEYPQKSELFVEPGTFGENICTVGMTEETVCIGDIYSIGEATVQVSQGRQPCWKLNVRFEIESMAMRLQETKRSGWYYRVLEPGLIAQGDEIRLDERPNDSWPIARVLHFFHDECLNETALKEITNLKELCSPWRQIAERRLAKKEVEDWTSRVLAPDAE